MFSCPHGSSKSAESWTSSELGLCSSNAKREEAKELKGMPKKDYKDGLWNLSWMVIKGRA